MKNILLFLSISLLFSCTGKVQEATLLLDQGKGQEERGALDSAIISYKQAIELLEQTKNSEVQGDVYNQIGDLYLNHSLYSNAYEMFRKSLEYNSVLIDKTQTSYSFRGMGKSYAYRDKIDSALNYYLQAYKLIPQIKDSNEIANIYNNLSNIFLEQKHIARALQYINTALLFYNDSINIYRSYFIKANIFIEDYKYDSALIYLKKSVHSKNIYTKAGCYFQLSELAKRSGDNNYMIYMEKYHALNDSIELLSKGVNIISAEAQYIITQQSQISMLWIICILLISFCCFYFSFYYYKKKINKTKKQLRENEVSIQEVQTQLHIILKNIQETGEICKVKFMKSKEYSELKKKMREDMLFRYSEQEKFSAILLNYFAPYINCLSSVVIMTSDNYYLCCLFLIGFDTKQCAKFRNITENGLRTQKGRICQKIKEVFGANMTFESFFNLPKKTIKPIKKNFEGNEAKI